MHGPETHHTTTRRRSPWRQPGSQECTDGTVIVKTGCSYLSKEDFGRAIVALTGAVEHACILSPVDMAELIRMAQILASSCRRLCGVGSEHPPPSKVPFNWSWRGPRGGRGEGGLKVWRLETFKPPSNPVHAPFKPPSSPLRPLFKPSEAAFVEAPLKPLEAPLIWRKPRGEW